MSKEEKIIHDAISNIKSQQKLIQEYKKELEALKYKHKNNEAYIKGAKLNLKKLKQEVENLKEEIKFNKELAAGEMNSLYKQLEVSEQDVFRLVVDKITLEDEIALIKLK